MPFILKAASFQFWKIQAIKRVVGVSILWLLLAGCASAVQRPLPSPTPTVIAPQAWPALFGQQSTAEAAVTALILAERQAAIDHDLTLLSELWAADAQIIDGRNNAVPIDDYRWQGRAAILNRYVVAVFPFYVPPLPGLEPTAIITVTDAQATVQNGNDHWQLRKVNDRWWLTELRYGAQ